MARSEVKKSIYPPQILQKYGQYLSPLGKRVMSVLMNLQEERKSKINTPVAYKRIHQNKKVLTFENSHSSGMFTDLPSDVSTTADDGVRITTTMDHGSSSRLSETVDNDHIAVASQIEDERNDFTYSSLKLYQSDLTEKEDHTLYPVPDDIFNEITWKNMFDTEIFGYHKDSNNYKSTFEDSNSNFFSEFCDKNKSKATFEYNLSTEEIYKAKHETTVRLNNNDQNKGTIDTPRKTVTKRQFQKEKYTTTIKNWLNDTDKVNSIDREINDDPLNHDDSIMGSGQNKGEKRKLKRKANEAITDEKKTKTSVQTKLANNDGVMKYTKSNDATEKDKEGKEGKLTFVAPIESQIPVKDVTCNIVHIEHCNKPILKSDNANSDEDPGSSPECTGEECARQWL